ncbi:hypothetical protein [Streptomyces sp. NPDC096351]|uniref:hypothetical protein n=1 Tax=Streptomyces sp. NPDC096351 TaxID=3366087 RepID=UPI00382CF7CD
MKYFEGNPEIFAALVAAIAIVGGLLGSIIGAKIQANGGRDQATAARDAARIAAEAQRVAALWTVRQGQIAEFTRKARELVGLAEDFYRRPIDADQRQRANEAYAALDLLRAEIELTAPKKVVAATLMVYHEAGDFAQRALNVGPITHAYAVLEDLARGEGEAAARASAALDALNADSEHVAGVLPAVSAVPGLSVEQVHLLVYGLSRPLVRKARRRGVRTFIERTNALTAAAREMLGSEDDVAPSMPPERRRWWRAA